ncbi:MULTISPECIES: DUF4097 family beta strand repeat-containing protein [Shewanella]|uniref:DUF4097 domain-containing protein n=1 Tax=Shewanella marisflavi TaxID=260364 RepID=A0AAC9TYY7_9GAMM|nr:MULTISPECIES: DUF4097 family beta strand repeat-containing protein [Shewanella]ASJ95907.1 hypothetical protein CFF01_04485 [Shewanella marisflavi]QDF74459.1 DUF4097 domain-containing protein [Shewanella marisflavi]
MKMQTKTAYLAMPLLLLSQSLLAAQSVDKRIEVEGDLRLNLEVQRGDVEILSWDQNAISITGTLDELSEGLVVEQKAGTISIEDKLPRHYSGSNKEGSRLTIKVPAKLKLNSEGVSANYRVSQLSGDINVQTVSGDIKVESLKEQVFINTVSGDISSQGLQGKLKLETVSGNIKDKQSLGKVSYTLVSGELNADSSADQVSIELVSGDAKVTLDKVDRLKAQSVSGDLNLSVSALATKASLDSVSGDISFSLPATLDATFAIDGGPSGDIDNRLTQDKPKRPKYGPGSSLQFQMGNGSADIIVSTISGEINLKAR